MADPVVEPTVPEPAPDSAKCSGAMGTVGFAMGIAATVPAMIIFVISGGLVGHGDYVVARLIFPIPMLLVAMAPESALLGMRTRLSLGIFALLAVLHVFAAVASFTELAFLF